MSAVWQRFDLFLGGYSEVALHFISNDVSHLIMVYITTLIVNTIINVDICEFEIFMDKITCLFRKPSYYKMDLIHPLKKSKVTAFKKAHNKQKIAEQFNNENSLKSIQCDTFYENEHCLSFIQFTFTTACNGIYRVSVIGDDDNIIQQSDWILFEHKKQEPVPLVDQIYYAPSVNKAAKSFFYDTLDTANNGLLSIHQWTDYLTKEPIIKDDQNEQLFDIAKRYFHYLIFLKNNEKTHHKKMYTQLLTCDEFERFVYQDGYRKERLSPPSCRSMGFLYTFIRWKIVQRFPKANNSYYKDPPIMPDI